MNRFAHLLFGFVFVNICILLVVVVSSRILSELLISLSSAAFSQGQIGALGQARAAGAAAAVLHARASPSRRTRNGARLIFDCLRISRCPVIFLSSLIRFRGFLALTAVCRLCGFHLQVRKQIVKANEQLTKMRLGESTNS